MADPWQDRRRRLGFPLVGAVMLFMSTATVRPAAQPSDLKVREICTLEVRNPGQVALSRDGKRIVTATVGEGVALWDVDRRKIVRRLTEKNGGRPVAFSTDGKRILSGGYDSTIHVWSTATGKELLRLAGGFGPIACALFSPRGGNVLAVTTGTANLSPVIFLSSLKNGREVRRSIWRDARGTQALAFAPDGKRFAFVGWHGVELWSVSAWKQLRQFEGHEGVVRSVAFSPDGRQLLTGGADHTLRLWNVATGAEIRRLVEPAGSVNGVAILPGGRYAVSGAGGEYSVTPVANGMQINSRFGKEQAVRLWDLQTGKAVHTFTGPASAVLTVGLSGDGRRLMARTVNGTVHVWELPNLKALPRAQSDAK